MKKRTFLLVTLTTLLMSVTPISGLEGILNNGITAEAAPVTVSKSIKVSKYGTVKKDNYSLWSNFQWKKKGDTKQLYNQTIYVKYKYNHSNGSSYYSLYDAKDTWLGYVNTSAVTLTSGKQGTAIKANKSVEVTSKNYQIYQNFSWKKKNDSKNLKGQTLTVKNEYRHFNGSTYYSLFDKNNSWLGYINKSGTKEVVLTKPAQGDPILVNKYATIVKDNYNFYENFNWKKKQNGSAFKNKTLLVKAEYHHSNGSTYYATYDNKDIFQGFISKKATKENGSKGIYNSYNKYVGINNPVTLVAYRDIDKLDKTFSIAKEEQSAVLAKGVYYHFNGLTYYSLYDKNNKWLGYVEKKQVTLDVNEAGKGVSIYRNLVVTDAQRTTYKNFKWDKNYNTKDLLNKKLVAKRAYHHYNGETYYSLFDEKGKWYGYLEAKYTKANSPIITGTEDKTIYMSDNIFNELLGVEAVDFNDDSLEVKVDGSVDIKKAGTYKLTYTAVDKEGNKTTVSSKITVVDDFAPVFTGIKDETMKQTADYGFDKWVNVFAHDFEGNQIEFTISGEVDAKKVGTYELIYSATDKRKHTTNVTRTIHVTKVADPTLKGVDDVTVNKSVGTFDPLKGVSGTTYSIYDTPEITISGVVDMAKSGVYELTYTATDNLGQKVSKKRKVTVLNDIKPTIMGVDHVKQNITVGKFDANAGVSAIDSNGNTIKYTVKGNVNPLVVGNYELVYTASDKDNNKIEVKRTVEIYQVEVTDIYINGNSFLKIGRTTQLNANVQPEEALDKTIAWSSSNEAVATVDQTGQVTTYSQGTSVITATAKNGVSATYSLNVSNDISGSFYVNSIATINNLVKSFGTSFRSYENENLIVKNVSVGEEGGRFSNYSKEKLELEGLSTLIQPNGSFSFGLNSKLGWWESKLVIRLTVVTEDGIEKTFEARR